MEKEKENPTPEPAPALPIASAEHTVQLFAILSQTRDKWHAQDKEKPKPTTPQKMVFYSGVSMAIFVILTGVFAVFKLELLAAIFAALFLLALLVWLSVGIFDFITRDFRELSQGKVAFEGSKEFETATHALTTEILEKLNPQESGEAIKAIQRVLRARKRALEVSKRILGYFSLSSSTGLLAQLTAGVTFIGLVLGLVNGKESESIKAAGFLPFDVSVLITVSPWLIVPLGAVLGFGLALIGVSEGNRWVEREIVALEDAAETLKLAREAQQTSSKPNETNEVNT
jgi:hypothetical protein